MADMKPRERGLFGYLRHFVGQIFGWNKTSKPGQDLRPHEKGFVEYTRDFGGGVVGRKDDDNQKERGR